MKIIVHAPNTPAARKELQKLTAKVHTQQIAFVLHTLSCPLKQKLQIFDIVADTLLQMHSTKSKKT